MQSPFGKAGLHPRAASQQDASFRIALAESGLVFPYEVGCLHPPQQALERVGASTSAKKGGGFRCPQRPLVGSVQAQP